MVGVFCFTAGVWGARAGWLSDVRRSSGFLLGRALGEGLAPAVLFFGLRSLGAVSLKVFVFCGAEDVGASALLGFKTMGALV